MMSPKLVIRLMRLGRVSVYHARVALGLPVWDAAPELGAARDAATRELAALIGAHTAAIALAPSHRLRVPSELETRAALALCAEALTAFLRDAAIAARALAQPGAARKGRVSARRDVRREIRAPLSPAEEAQGRVVRAEAVRYLARVRGMTAAAARGGAL